MENSKKDKDKSIMDMLIMAISACLCLCMTVTCLSVYDMARLGLVSYGDMIIIMITKKTL